MIIAVEGDVATLTKTLKNTVVTRGTLVPQSGFTYQPEEHVDTARGSGTRRKAQTAAALQCTPASQVWNHIMVMCVSCCG